MFSPVFASSFSFDSQSSSKTVNTDGSTFLSAKLTLDMSFNRHPEGRFASDVDPLDQSGSTFVQPTPTFESVHEETYGLDTVLHQWKFPLRTDFARGIIWGPFRHCRGNSYADLASPEAALENLHSASSPSLGLPPYRPSSHNKRRRRLSSTTTFSTRPSRAAPIIASKSLQTTRQPKKAKFITLAITLTPVRRIRLCATSQLKYTDL
ncbi:hypothetical protein VP01_1213g8 [Puccinia sorghi]|uniref:Uncharacterized protein n=1 Tax=Puccinia sorghi TaxID=27349 RepID=A0A0L6VQA0_9BASI|nr:hypothetical protein VP01_1213g8 [Puccinia sorghi]